MSGIFRHLMTLCGIATLVSVQVVIAGSVPSPKEVLGIDVGQDRVLASYGDTERYIRALAANSDRVKLLTLGQSVEGRTMVALAISEPGNIQRLDELRKAWALLANPKGLSASERETLIAKVPSCALITASIHGNEVAGGQAALLLAYRLASAPAGSKEASWLARTVVLLVPSLNPDGQEAVVAWYRKYLGTPYEGSSLPGLYHRYSGHDNNRDFVFLTQPESRALNQFVYHQWHPQLFIDLHQMGSTGPRQFVPPFADPIAPNVHPLIWRMTSHLGTLISLRLEEQGKSGVVSGWTFDGNWIGGTRNTGWWKNVIGILTETASSAIATPINVDENELRAGGKGLVDYRQQVNFPNPWRGGKWGLADAVDYALAVMGGFIEFAAIHGADAMSTTSTMALEAIDRGEQESPRAYLVPPSRQDSSRSRRLISLLREAGAESLVAVEGIRADGLSYPAGTVVFPTSQPLRQYLLEVMEKQHYPEITPAPNAEILLPYDITAWTMPLELGVQAVRVEGIVEGKLVPMTAMEPTREEVTGSGSWAVIGAGQLGGFAVANQALAKSAKVVRLTNGATGPGGWAVSGLDRVSVGELSAKYSVRVTLQSEEPSGSKPLRQVRVGVYHPDYGLEDAGWCRFVLEQANFKVAVIDNRSIVSGDLATKIDVLILPSMDGKTFVEGVTRMGSVGPPPEYRKGIGKDGVETLKRFFKQGGTILAFGAIVESLAETLELPVSNSLKGVKHEEYECPGALLSLAIERETEIGWGMSAKAAAMFEGSVAFTTRPSVGSDLRIVAARFPDESLVLSGWMRGDEKLRRRGAVVEVRKDGGRAVLYAFAPFFRGQTEALFPLIFNAISEEMMEKPLEQARPTEKE